MILLRRPPLRPFRSFAPALVLACTLLAGASLPAQEAPDTSREWTGRWEGEIELPQGAGKLGVIVNLRAPEGNGTWSGTVDIPMQGARDLPLTDITIRGTTATFAIGVPGQPVFQGTLSGGKVTGTLNQSDMSLNFWLGRERVAEAPKPQDPKPPFPYKIEEVTYTNGTVRLAGTLTTPEGAGPFPAVLLLTGSGSQDRDETIFGHRPFWVLADHLSRRGIAVLRVDDRGMGGSTGDPQTSTSADFAQDALAGVHFLQARPGIDPKKVGLLGHSEGGVVAPLAASQSADVAFLVLLAGSGVPGEQIVLRQMELLARARGENEEKIATQVARQKRIFEALRTKTPAEAEAEIRTVVSLGLQELTSEQVRSMGGAIMVTERAVNQATSPWFRYFMTYDPRTALRQLKRPPVLALIGEKDLQVPPDQSLPEIEKALRAAGNKDVTAVTVPGLNHLFQPATTGALEEYAASTVTFDPGVLDRIADWIGKRFAKPQPGARK